MKAEYIDHCGSDLTVVNAARVSFNKQSNELVEKDTKLIKYLASHNHFTPFTHCFVTLRETVPLFVARQRFKHTVGFSYNEVSRRYVDDPPEFYYPDKWRKKSDNKKQGSSDETIENICFIPDYFVKIDSYYEILMDCCKRFYEKLIDSDIAPEQARMVLPQSMYTSYYVSGSLAAWARAYNLRSKPDAQKEIQELAEQWKKLIEPLFPVSWKELTA